MSLLNALYTIILYPLVQLIEFSFQVFMRFSHNTGISVMGVSFTVTLLCLPLYIVAEKWQETERKTQAKLKPSVDHIKDTFKGDEQYMILSAFYKESHYHPIMALRSSFGLLIQIPFFMAAYTCLSNLQSLNGTSFAFIKDMGTPDRFFKIGSFYVNILPILMTLINCVAGAIYTKGFPVKEKIQIYGMAFIFLVLLYQSPSGLVLYWTMNNVFSLVKNVFYKLKHPIKVFYYCVLIACLLGIIFVLFVFHTKKANKLIFISASLFIMIVPLYVKIFAKLLNTRFSSAVDNKKIRYSLFLASSLLLLFLTGLSIPARMVSSSPAEFCGIGTYTTPYFIFTNTFLQSVGIFIFWASCIYFLFGKRIQTLLSFFMVFFALGSIADTFIFQGNYGDISSGLVFLNLSDFNSFGIKSILNILFLALLFVSLCFFVFFKEGKTVFFALNILTVAIIGLAVPDFFYISKEVKKYSANAGEGQNTEVKPIFTLSRNKKNVILLFIDKAQAQFIPEMLKENPDLEKSFSGFVNYPQVLSFNGHTLMGAPGMLAGYEYTPYEMQKRSSELLVEKHNESLLVLPRIFTEQLGYTAAITDPPWANYNTFIDTSFADSYPNIEVFKTRGSYNDLWFIRNPKAKTFNSTEKVLKRNMLYFCLFREVPIFFREFIYHKGTYWSSDENSNNFSTLIDNYAPMDFLTDLTKAEDTEKGSYINLTSELAHTSCFLQAPNYVPEKNVSNFGTSSFSMNQEYHTQMATFILLAKWFDYLKEEGVYDNSRIVIVSDHGGEERESDFEENEELDKKISGGFYKGRGHYHCLLMYKDFYKDGSIQTDNTFMTNADTISLLLNNMGECKNPFTNKKIPTLNDVSEVKKNGIYLTSSDAHQPFSNGKYEFKIKDEEWWHVKENIFKAENWVQEVPHD